MDSELDTSRRNQERTSLLPAGSLRGYDATHRTFVIVAPPIQKCDQFELTHRGDTARGVPPIRRKIEVLAQTDLVD